MEYNLKYSPNYVLWNVKYAKYIQAVSFQQEFQF